MDAAIHLVSVAMALVAAALSLYVSNRLLNFKNEVMDDAKKDFPSKDSFDAHEEQDEVRFNTLERNAAQRHGELRDDISKAHERIDGMLRGGTR